MTVEAESRVDRAFRDGAPIDRAMNRVGQAAIEAHRQAGVPLVVWRDGRVVYLDPFTLEEVPAPEDHTGPCKTEAAASATEQ